MEVIPVSRAYYNFRGVDFRGEEVDFNRSPDALNMWKDYNELDSIRTRPGLELLQTFTDKIFGIFFYDVGNRKMILVHSGNKLYKIENGGLSTLYTGVGWGKSQCFVYNNIFYFKDGISYLRYDGQTISDVVGFVPTTSIGRLPAGGGSIYQDVNMLSNMRINTFVGDGESKDYYLDAPNIDSVVSVEVNGNPTTEYTVNTEKGMVTFNTAPPIPLTDGQDNVKIQYSRTVSDYRERIEKCTLLQVFDNRVFFSGNPNYPNTVWHSSLNDPTYCSDLDYYNEGLDLSPVRSMIAGNNALWVIKEPSQANTTIFYHNPVIDSNYGKVYPSTHSSIYTGCVGAGINFNDDIVFFSERGMEAISGDVTTEQVLQHRSVAVDRKLTVEPKYKEMLLEEWNGYLLVFIGNHVYLADSRAYFLNETHNEYEWYYWELDEEVTASCVKDGVLYIGTSTGVYTLTDNTASVKCHWTTPKDKFKYPQYRKTTNKKGSVCECLGDVLLEVKTDKSQWERVNEYTNVQDYFVARIKKKKFKDMQLRFSSTTRFSLESITIESYIGGYIKR